MHVLRRSAETTGQSCRSNIEFESHISLRAMTQAASEFYGAGGSHKLVVLCFPIFGVRATGFQPVSFSGNSDNLLPRF